MIGFLVAPTLRLVHESMTVKPYEWQHDPVILNCYGKDFSKLQLERAISYWSSKGYSVAFYEMDPSEKICKSYHLDGFIILRKAKDKDLKSSTLAETTRLTSRTKIKSVVILFKPGTQNLTNLIEHELGHAFGFSHIEEEGHIMHPRYDKMGSLFWIP